MTTSAKRLYDRQVALSTRADGTVDVDRLGALVMGAYAEYDADRRRTERAAELMSTELEEANAALEQSVTDLQAQNIRFALALDNMADGMALFDSEGRLVVCNRRQREMLSLAEDQVAPGSSLSAFLSASPVLSDALVQERLQNARTGVETEYQQTLLDGREVRIVLRRVPDGGFLTTCEDVTDRTRAAARLAHLAYHDPLTDLPNRTLLRERFSQALSQGKCAVLCLDLDGFKRVNDTLGHAMGDALLRAVSARLRLNLCNGETLARLGGDEFAVLIAGGTAEAEVIATQIINLLTSPFDVEEHTIVIGTSIGIAVSPAHGQTSGELLYHADMALYRAKAAGRACHRVFEVQMSTDAMMARRKTDLTSSRKSELTTV